MRFLRHSPFVRISNSIGLETIEDDHELWAGAFDSLNKKLHAIGITDNGKHVILQQTAKSCVPSCVAMLVLDHGKTPNYEAIKSTYLATKDAAIQWVKEAGLNPEVTTITGTPKHRVAQTLKEAIQKHGSGVLTISHPKIGFHDIVLDEISIETNSAIIRDPFHGWCLTIKLDSLLSWHPAYFLQIRSDAQQSSQLPMSD
jgi:hypothetical protein